MKYTFKKSLLVAAVAAGLGYNQIAFALATGTGAVAHPSSAAYGDLADASGAYSLAGGQQAVVTGDGSVGLGFNVNVSGGNAVALGMESKSTSSAGVALGFRAVTSGANSVAIGNSSTDAGADNVVSVGGDAIKRKVINMADGVVSAASLEAINGSQLFETNAAVTAAADAATDAAALAQQGVDAAAVAQLAADTAQAGVDTNAANITVLQGEVTALDGRVTQNEGDITTLQESAVQYSTDGTAVVLNDNAGAGTALGNVADGVVAAGSMDAVNGGQLYAVRDLAQAGVDAAADAQADVDALGGVVAGHTAQLANHEGRIGVLEGTVAEHTQQIGDLRGDVTVLQSDVVTAQETADDAVARANAAQADVDALEPVVAGHTKELATHTKELETHTQQIGVLQKDVVTAQSTADKALALGANSAQYDADGGLSLNVHEDGTGSQIHNVADGTSRYDAVNLGQLQAGDAATYNKSTKYAAKGVAAAMAMPSVDIENCDEQGLNLALGHYDGQSAVGVAYARRVGKNMTLSGGMSYAGKDSLGAKLGAGWSW